MAGKAGIYKALWRPEELEATRAEDILLILEKGYTDLKRKPEYFKKFNPENGWGSYDGLVSFVERYLDACKEYPKAIIYISR